MKQKREREEPCEVCGHYHDVSASGHGSQPGRHHSFPGCLAACSAAPAAAAAPLPKPEFDCLHCPAPNPCACSTTAASPAASAGTTWSRPPPAVAPAPARRPQPPSPLAPSLQILSPASCSWAATTTPPARRYSRPWA
jgi:hypothetical protein